MKTFSKLIFLCFLSLSVCGVTNSFAIPRKELTFEEAEQQQIEKLTPEEVLQLIEANGLAFFLNGKGIDIEFYIKELQQRDLNQLDHKEQELLHKIEQGESVEKLKEKRKRLLNLIESARVNAKLQNQKNLFEKEVIIIKLILEEQLQPMLRLSLYLLRFLIDKDLRLEGLRLVTPLIMEQQQIIIEQADEESCCNCIIL